MTPVHSIRKLLNSPDQNLIGKVEAAMLDILPRQILHLIADYQLLPNLKRLNPGEHLTIKIAAPYAADSISFDPLWKRDDCSEEKKREIHKKILGEYMCLGGWVSQRNPEQMYMNIWFGTTEHPIPSDAVRTIAYIRFIQEQVPKILREELGPFVLDPFAYILLTRGTTLDPKSGDPQGEILFCKNTDDKILAAQNMPATEQFLFPAIVPTAAAEILENMVEDQLPLAIPGKRAVALPHKRSTVHIDLISAAKDYQQIEKSLGAETLPEDPHILHWCYEHLADGYFTPKSFFTFLQTHNPNLQLNTEKHQVIDIIIERVATVRAGYPIETEAHSSTSDLSGMTQICSALGKNQNSLAAQGFERVLRSWQIRTVAILTQNGYATDELAGDGLNAYNFETKKENLDITTRIEMAFQVNRLWNDLLTSQSPSIQAFREFLAKNKIEPVMKTALTDLDSVTVRWYRHGIDVLPRTNTLELLSELKIFLQANNRNAIILSTSLYDRHSDSIKRGYEVIKLTGFGAIIAKKEQPGNPQVAA